METFLLYQVKVSVLLAVFYLGYRLLLGRETFHRFNRIVLITIALISFVLPFFHITRYIDKPLPATRIESIESQSIGNDNAIQPSIPSGENWSSQTPADELVSQLSTNTATPAAVSNPQPARRSIEDLLVLALFVIYWVGFLWVIVRKIISVSSMARIIKTGRYANRLEGCDVIESDLIPQPLNWMRFIVMPREWLEHENALIWKHENLHASRWHSLDLLMADVMTALQWFNPVIILLHKEFELIHEYEADQAVIESGADDTEYKLMLVDAVASSRGMVMTNWLKQSNLKKRIDMMDKFQSNGWNRLRALFIPVIMCLFLFATATKVYGKKNNPTPGQFQKHVVWVFDNGNAKVKLDNAQPVDMKLDAVPAYLKKQNKKNGISRITLRYMYDIAGLADAQPLAEQVSDLGIKVSIANNDEMLDKIYMPEYRCARIYDEGNGQYRFELNCHSQEENRRIRESGSYQYTDANGKIIGGATFGDGVKYVSSIKDLSITGDMELMKKWIGIFDGHGVGIYPVDMPYTDVEQMAQAAWKCGINQVSMVSGYAYDGKGGVDQMVQSLRSIVVIPKDSEWSKEYPGENARSVIFKRETATGWGYVGKGTAIANPKIFYNSNTQDFNISYIVKTPDELIVIFQAHQGPDLWITGFNSMELVAADKRYKQIAYEGLVGFEKAWFWSPDDGLYVQSMHFEPIPDDVKVVDLYNKDVNATVIKGLQVSDDLSYYDNIRTVRVMSGAFLKTTHVNEQQKDEVRIERIDLSDNETTIYLNMMIREPRSFMGYVGSDFVLTLHDGTQVKPIRYDGVPTDKDFDRNGDYMDTPFQIIFPPLSKDAFNYDGVTLAGTICHEPLRFMNLQNLEIANLRATLSDMLERDNDFFINYFTHYRNLKMLLSNINDKNLFGGDSPLSFTMDQRAEFLRKLSIKEQDLDKLIKAQAYIIIYNKRFIYIAEPEASRIDMSLPLGSMGGVSAPTDPYEYLKNNPNISVDEEGNWYAYGKKAVIWEINQPAGEKTSSPSGMRTMGGSRPFGSMSAQPMGGVAVRPMGGSQSMSNEGMVQQTNNKKNNYEYVDLGLSVKWATCNMGAEKPEDSGDYFAWGEAGTKSTFKWDNYKFRISGNSYQDLTFSKYNTDPARGSVDSITVLAHTDDVAHVRWGGNWRMPTIEEFQELIDNCTWTWTELNDSFKSGYIVKSNIPGYTDRSIFLPAAGWKGEELSLQGMFGCYWTASLNSHQPFSARRVEFAANQEMMALSSGTINSTFSASRANGLSVRPVCP